MATVTSPAAPQDSDWTDVRMTDPDDGEWNLDAVVVDGQVEYVDLRVRSDLVAPFVACLLEDLPRRRTEEVVERLGGIVDTDADDASTEATEPEATEPEATDEAGRDEPDETESANHEERDRSADQSA